MTLWRITASPRAFDDRSICEVTAAASIFTAAAAIALSAVAVADPDAPPAAPSAMAPPAPPTDPGALPPTLETAPGPLADRLTSSFGVPLGPAGLNIFGQSTASTPVAGALGLPQGTSGLSRSDVLGQNVAPSAPGAGPGTPPNLNVFNNAYGQQECLTPSAPGQCQQFGVEPGQENADVPARQWLGRYIDMYRDGRLKGGLLAQMPQQQLGEPMPGTAPSQEPASPRG